MRLSYMTCMLFLLTGCATAPEENECTSIISTALSVRNGNIESWNNNKNLGAEKSGSWCIEKLEYPQSIYSPGFIVTSAVGSDSENHLLVLGCDRRGLSLFISGVSSASDHGATSVEYYTDNAIRQLDLMETNRAMDEIGFWDLNKAKQFKDIIWESRFLSITTKSKNHRNININFDTRGLSSAVYRSRLWCMGTVPVLPVRQGGN